MNKLELIKNLKEECQITKKEAAAVVDLFFNEMANALAEGDRVEIRIDFMHIYLAWQRKR